MKKTITSKAVERKTINKFIKKIKEPKGFDELPQVLQNQTKYEIKRDRILVMTLFLSAGRISEVLQLRKLNFDFTLQNSKLYQITDMVNLKNKNRDHKTIGFPVDDSFSNEIREFVEKIRKPNMLLFPQRKVVFGYAKNRYIDRPMNRKTALNRIQRYDSKLWCHWFRHARLSDLAIQGLPDRALTAISGHASSNMLQVYVVMSPALYEDKIRGG